MSLISPSLTRSVFAIMHRSSEEAILPRYRALETHHVSVKALGDVVTLADHESELLLTEGLSRLLPDAAIIGEESAHSDPSLIESLGDPLCWIIDPLDGTNNFASGHPPFGVLIALAEAGEAIAGWIYDPLTGRSCHAERGKGAFVNGERIHSVGSRQDKPIVAISMALVDPKHKASMCALLKPSCSLVDIPRCAAEQYPRIALGQNDVAFFNRTHAWDHAAGALFLNEAGGMAARHDGSPYRVNDDKIGLLAAATPALWDWTVDLLRHL